MELSAFAHLTRRNVKVIQPGLVYVIDWSAGWDPAELELALKVDPPITSLSTPTPTPQSNSRCVYVCARLFASLGGGVTRNAGKKANLVDVF